MRTEILKYISELGKILKKYSNLEKELSNEYFDSRSFDELKKENYEMYKDIIEFERSFGNPTYTKEVFGEEFGKILSVIYVDFRKLINYAFHHNVKMITNYNKLYINLTNAFEANEFTEIKIHEIYKTFQEESLKTLVSEGIQNTFTPMSPTNKIFNELDLNDSRYLFKYGEYISDNEIKLFDFMKNYSIDKLKELSKIIVDAYIRGFEKDGKDVTLRHNVRVYYNIGQELMVKEIFELLEKNNLKGMAIVADSTSPNKQCEFDHKFDHGLYFDKEYLEAKKLALNSIDEEIKKAMKDCSGILLIEKFGETPFIPLSKTEVIKLNEAQTKLSMEETTHKRGFIETLIPEKERSFCIIAFPSPEIGENFEEIYEETCKINSLDSSIYEPIQKTIIDTLDTGEFVKVKGQNGNETDITVAMQKLNNPEKETNFFNCTADVNIPLGEIFTSPKLMGTNGLLHLKKVFLNDLEFIELKLQFKDGYVVDYSCKNFPENQTNRKYIEENLLFPHKSLPLGEFAIGTNTLAYIIAKKYDIVDKLPILIVEKMGPHFAIGDTCYSWSEDLPVYNFDGKEIIARDNEHSCMRKEDVSKAYTNVHTDITLPYDELEFIKVITYNGTEINIIKEGRFVLEGTEYLNEAFKNS